jgi:chaperone modulatory protein CbpM
MRTREFLLAARLDASALAAWIEAGWLLPRGGEDAADFSEADLARARLISELQQEMGVNEEAVPIILDLLDQVHGLRQMLRDFATAFVAQPEDMRRRFVAEIHSASAIRMAPPAGEQTGDAGEAGVQ